MNLNLTKSKNLMSLDTFKNALDFHRPVSKVINLAGLEITPNNQVKIDGRYFNLTEQAQTDLFRMLDVTKTLTNNVGSVIGSQMRKNLLDLVKSVKIMGGKSPNLHVLVSRTVPTDIQRIVPTFGLLTSDAFFQILERLTAKGEFYVENMGINFDGSCFISCRKSDTTFQVGNFKDEVFEPGFVLTNSPTKGTTFSYFLYRQICSNGMVGRDSGSSVNLSDVADSKKFFEQIDFAIANNFIPKDFTAKVTKAINTFASFAEIETCAQLIKHYSDCPLDNVDLYVPYNDIRRQIIARGYDLLKFDGAHRRNIQTRTSIWDAINGVTWFASHNEGYKVSENGRKELMVKSGSMLSSKFDCELTRIVL